MPSTRTCPQCGAALPYEGWEGLCPKCLVRVSLENPDAATEPNTESAEPGFSARSHGIEPAGETLTQPRSDALIERTGMTIGRYRLLQQIGEGGFGVVYMAEQIDPVQRQVALKIIKAGMDTREIIARFEAERQALALMEHPNIAQVLDGGATAGGRPYFVMELVRGIPITDYCDQANLSLPERLKLFIKVCRAVQHAHQKGIIHRDLKPGNVLVSLHDGEAVPKVIDFGVAKALGQKLTGKTLLTRLEQMIGTPAYMSPEQAAMGGIDIDTRSDIYSLGVLLYELLTGATPLDAETLRHGAFEESRRMIQDTDPPDPSTRLSTLGERLAEVATRRAAEPGELTRLIRGDLDWIAMKALEKDRQRRYETVNGLAMDIERHLRNEPVVARPPSAFYRLQKVTRRHRLAVTVGAVLTLSLVLGLVASTWQAVRATRAEGLARVQSAENEAMMEILAQTLSRSDPTGESIRQSLLDATTEWLNREHPGEEQQVELFVRRMQANMANLRKGSSEAVAGMVPSRTTSGAFGAQPQALTNLQSNLRTPTNIAWQIPKPATYSGVISQTDAALSVRPKDGAFQQLLAEAQAKASKRTSTTAWPFPGVVFVASPEVIGKEGIRGIVVRGPEFLKEKGFEELEQRLAKLLGNPITELEILRVQKTVVDWCRSEGHPLVDVAIPSQQNENGLLQVIVFEKIRAAQFSPNGRTLLVDLTNLPVQIWDLNTGQPLTNAFKILTH